MSEVDQQIMVDVLAAAKNSSFQCKICLESRYTHRS